MSTKVYALCTHPNQICLFNRTLKLHANTIGRAMFPVCAMKTIALDFVNHSFLIIFTFFLFIYIVYKKLNSRSISSETIEKFILKYSINKTFLSSLECEKWRDFLLMLLRKKKRIYNADMPGIPLEVLGSLIFESELKRMFSSKFHSALIHKERFR